MSSGTYAPNIVVHPGRTLQDLLETSKMLQVELAQRTGLTPKTINEIIQGKNPITPDTAIKLAGVFGMSTTFWNNLERNYQETRARIRAEEKIESEIPNLAKFKCYGELVHWGYVKSAQNKRDKIANLLSFFGVSSLGLIPKIHAVAFRCRNHESFSAESIAAWLRCGEIEAQKISTKPFNKTTLVESMEFLRALTREEVGVFQKELVKICSLFGVAVVFVPHFKHTYVNGMTKWIAQDKALIQLSVKGSYDDIFWFSFFHELGHLVKHGKKDQFLEFEKKGRRGLQEKENEADEYASHALIPKSEYAKFRLRGDFSVSGIKKFADSINISPSVVAGRLSHDTNTWTKWNHLRSRLKFVRS